MKTKLVLLALLAFGRFALAASSNDPITAETCLPQPDCRVMYSEFKPAPSLNKYSDSQSLDVACEGDDVHGYTPTAYEGELDRVCGEMHYDHFDRVSETACQKGFRSVWARVQYQCVAYARIIYHF